MPRRAFTKDRGEDPGKKRKGEKDGEKVKEKSGVLEIPPKLLKPRSWDLGIKQLMSL